MLEFLQNLVRTKDLRDDVVHLLKTNPETLEAFENAYAVHAISPEGKQGFFDVSAKEMAESINRGTPEAAQALDELCARIVRELLSKARVWQFDGKSGSELQAISPIGEPVTLEELLVYPEAVRPQVTGMYSMMDTPVGAGLEVLRYYMMYLKEKNPAKKQEVYHRFRQGLDILDLDALMYAMLGMNQNSMGYWLPIIADTVVRQGFFRIPKTTIVKVPITLLQLSRIDYERVNATTRRILDEFCKQAFHLDTAQDYFIKTGTYSSKFDFRNTHVQAGQEVNELGEYLLFIQNQACLMAGPLNTPSIYGASTTNEWVVREYIPDIEKNPTIYKGLPLHTEYRVFVDFDRGCVLGVNPYWDAATMKRRFSDASDANSPHMKHDYVIYCAHEDVLMRRYQENVGRVTEAVEKLAQEIAKSGALHGQWSMDIMQNGEDFWFIDMGWAQNSALKECVPKGLLRPSEEAWLPIDQLQALQEALSAEA